MPSGLLSLALRIATLKGLGRTVDRVDYDPVAPTYERTWLSRVSHLNRALLAASPLSEGARAIDLATGTGFNVGLLAARDLDVEVEAVDVSKAMLARARAAHGAAPGATIDEASMEESLARAGPGAFDLVVCTWALCYARPRRILRLARRALAPGGALALADGLATSFAPIRRAAERILVARRRAIARDMELRVFASASALDRVLARLGFEPRWRRTETVSFPFDSWAEAARFAFASGVMAGYEAMFDPPDRGGLERDLARELEREPSPPLLALDAIAGVWEVLGG